MLRVRTKICGVTRVEDALCAANSGADAIGLVFYAPSPRNVSIEQAQKICAALPPFVTVVALFVDEQRKVIEQVCQALPIDLLQFHGGESEKDCLGFTVPYIKAIRVRSDSDVRTAEAEYKSAQAILVDTYKKGVAGGTGALFDWSLLPAEHNKPLILAGGLTPENIRKAIQTVQPYAVDISGGVELEKNIKDHEKISQFIKEVSRECGEK
ncbi:MAG: phosphoribosylanthranilate isomerase [Pseudohongiellaceae bacterium]|jgi:phosphoribosylanthranilate isomerase